MATKKEARKGALKAMLAKRFGSKSKDEGKETAAHEKAEASEKGEKE